MIKFILRLCFYAFAQNCQSPLPQTLKYYIVSDSNTLITGVPNEFNAVSAKIHPGWIAQIPGAIWIWDTYAAADYQTVKFKVQFILPGVPISGVLRISFDDTLLSLTINGIDPGCNFSYTNAGSETTCNISNQIVPGLNTVLLSIKNYLGNAGLLYMIDISMTV